MVRTDIMDRRRELGDFTRACRERLRPADIGLPTAGRRRTPGLRREEVAQLSNLSTTWYTWLEQGRDVSASPTALARLANALRLNRAERTYLFELAGRTDPDRGDSAAATISATLRASVEAIAAPAYILDRTWNALAWNGPAAGLFVGWLDKQGAPANLLRYIFLSDTARALIRDHEARARRVVAEFRADVSTHLEDPDVRDLLNELRRESRLFAQLWEDHAVLGREGGVREFDHPVFGLVAYDQVTFNVAGFPGLKLTMLVRPV